MVMASRSGAIFVDSPLHSSSQSHTAEAFQLLSPTPTRGQMDEADFMKDLQKRVARRLQKYQDIRYVEALAKARSMTKDELLEALEQYPNR